MAAANTPEKTLSNKHGNLVICLLLTAAILAVFWQVSGYDFVNLDDDIYVTENPNVQPGLTLKGIIWSFGFTDTPYWHPLTWFSHMLDCQLFGLRPGMHHRTNLILHLVNTLLLFLVLRRMTGSLWKSTFVAALFGLHPLNVESVAWVASRKNLLSTLFWLLTLFSYAHYSEQPSLGRYLLICLLFVLGLMAKPMLVTLPFVLLLLDYWPLGRFRLVQREGHSDVETAKSPMTVSRARVGIRLVVEKVPLLVLSLLSIYITSLSVQRSGIVIPTELVSTQMRIENALVSCVGYITKMLWPRNLAVFYPYPTVLPVWQTLGAAFLLFCVSVLVLRAWKKIPYLVTGWLWYLGTLVPVIGLKQVGIWPAMADRFTYVPLIGLFIIVAWGMPDLLRRWHLRATFLASAGGLVVAALMLTTWTQLQYWKNSITLFEHALAVTGNNYVADNNLGNALEQQNRVDEAIRHLSKALELKPDFAGAHNNLGNALAKQGNLDGAVAHFSRAIQLKPDFAGAHLNLGNALEQQNRVDEAIFHFARALQLKPDFAEAYYNMGNVMARQGKLNEAAYHFSKALQFKPYFAEAHNNLGAILARQGKLNEAISSFTRAIEIKPDYPEAHNNLGVALARQGRLAEAIAHFGKALGLNPDYEQARANLKRAQAESVGTDDAL